MQVLDMFILVSIGQVVGWLATIYAEKDHRRLGVHLIVTTAGAFIGGYLPLYFISETAKYSMIFSAFFVATLMLYVLRFRKRRYEMHADTKRRPAFGISWSEMSLGKQITSIIVTLIVVTAIFSLLAGYKALVIWNTFKLSDLRINWTYSG